MMQSVYRVLHNLLNFLFEFQVTNPAKRFNQTSINQRIEESGYGKVISRT